MTQDTDVMESTNYPKDTMLAIADDRESAERAAQALRDAGFAEGAIRLMHGREAWEEIQRKKDERNIFERLWDNVQELDADEGRNSPQDYLTALEEGRSNILVHATDDESRHRAFQALKSAGAHNITYQWRALIEDLPADDVNRPNPDR